MRRTSGQHRQTRDEGEGKRWKRRESIDDLIEQGNDEKGGSRRRRREKTDDTNQLDGSDRRRRKRVSTQDQTDLDLDNDGEPSKQPTQRRHDSSQNTPTQDLSSDNGARARGPKQYTMEDLAELCNDELVNQPLRMVQMAKKTFLGSLETALPTYVAAGGRRKSSQAYEQQKPVRKPSIVDGNLGVGNSSDGIDDLFGNDDGQDILAALQRVEPAADNRQLTGDSGSLASGSQQGSQAEEEEEDSLPIRVIRPASPIAPGPTPVPAPVSPPPAAPVATDPPRGSLTAPPIDSDDIDEVVQSPHHDRSSDGADPWSSAGIPPRSDARQSGRRVAGLPNFYDSQESDSAGSSGMNSVLEGI